MQSVHNPGTIPATIPAPPVRQTTYTTTVHQPISAALPPTVTSARPPPLIPAALPPTRVRTPIAPASAAQVITTVPADPLAPLYDVDGIRIHQKVEYIEAVTKYETQNQYDVFALNRTPHHRVHRGVTTHSTTPTTVTTTTTSNRVSTKDMHIRPGPLLFKVREVSSVVGRVVAKSKRNAEFKLKNPVTGRVAMTLVRPYRVVGQYIAVYDGNGSYLGKIKKAFNPLIADLTVYDAYDNPLDRIRGGLKLPWMRTLKIKKGQYDVGVITKKFGGPLKETLTDADTFDLLFPHDISLEEKALLIAATIFIDMLFFEDNQSMSLKSFA